MSSLHERIETSPFHSLCCWKRWEKFPLSLVFCRLFKLTLKLELWLQLDNLPTLVVASMYSLLLYPYVSCIYNTAFLSVFWYLFWLTQICLHSCYTTMVLLLFCSVFSYKYITNISAECSYLSSPVIRPHFLSHYYICYCHSRFW